MNLKQSNNTNFENKSHLNYIDEVYFPDHTVDQHISASLSEKLSQKRIIPEGTSIRPESFGRTESQSLKVHSSLTEEKFTADSRVRRDTSVKSSESSSVQSTNLIDEHYFGSVLNVGNKTSKQEIKDSFSVNNKDFKTDDDTDQHNANLLGIQSSVNKQEMDFNEVDHQYFGDNFHDLNPNKEMFNKSADMGTHPSTFFEIVKDYTVQPNVSIINQEILPENNSYQQKHNVQEKIIQNEASDKQELIEKTDQSQLNLGNKVPLSATTRDQQNFDKRRLNEASERQKLNNTNQQVHRMKKEPLTSNVADQQKHNQKLSEAFGKEELAADSNILSSENFMKARKRTNVQVRPNLEKPETAYDLAMKIRNEMKRGIKIEEKPTDQTESVSKTTGDEKITDSGIKLDSKGYRVLDDQVPDLNKMTSADLVRMLKSKVIFDHEDFLAIDKPYGLPCISQQQDRVSVTELLPAFAEILPRSYKVSDLHLVHGLDRDVTGAIILAKNPEVAYILRGMYKNSDMITQRFWAITKGVPTPSAGLIDIPVGEAKVGNIYKMVLRPRYLKDEKMIRRTSKADSERAITQYKVLSSHMQSALVECTLLTNVKHQIRLHLASGLNTPILGDHKYSNFSKLAPQKLHTEMLDLLKIRQPMVRHLALHLHCRSVILKEYKGRMIFLTTYPPSHFRDNLRSLRIPKVQT
uniref:Pseudouridylate synthase RPUSD4, mitochondrial n=1 Tax=Arion vulgaris TaxID=1028688 RepID=A0A0B6ZP15_9EUPU